LLELKYYTKTMKNRPKKSSFLRGTRADRRMPHRNAAERAYSTNRYTLVWNTGAENRVIFSSKEDFDRFEAYLYLLNSRESPRVSNFFSGSREHNIFETGRGERLVAIGAYAYTPKSFYILIKHLNADGLSKFMQKLQTAYTMYFNKKYAHRGRLFHSAYIPEDATSEEHLKYLLSLVHLSPASLFSDDWMSAGEGELLTFAFRAMQYRYSSAGEYIKKKFIIVDPTEFPDYFLRTRDATVSAKHWIRFKKKLRLDPDRE